MHGSGHAIDDGLRHALDPEMKLVIAWRDVAEDEESFASAMPKSGVGSASTTALISGWMLQKM